MTGRKAVALPYETEAASRMSHPTVPGDRVNSQYRRDFPTPGSPTTATTCPCPDLARPSARSSCAISGSRPTKRVRPRAAAACRRDLIGDAPVTSYTSRGASRPLTDRGPSDRVRT